MENTNLDPKNAQLLEAAEPKEPTLNKNKAIAVGIMGIIIPIGIQDFYMHRFLWGTLHWLSLLLSPIAFFVYLFDGYCGGGKHCSSPPGIASMISSCVLGTALVMLVLNIVECVKLMSTQTIMFSKKRFAIVMSASITTIALLLYIFRVVSY